MQFRELVERAKTVQEGYRNLNQTKGFRPWTTAEYMQGFVGDVGDLTKLIMAKNNYRANENIDEKIAHELADCMWSIMVLASELGVDLETEFNRTMDELEERVKI